MWYNTYMLSSRDTAESALRPNLQRISVQRVAYVVGSRERGWSLDPSVVDGGTIYTLAWMLSAEGGGGTKRLVRTTYTAVANIANQRLGELDRRRAFPPTPDDWVFDLATGRLDCLPSAVNVAATWQD